MFFITVQKHVFLCYFCRFDVFYAYFKKCFYKDVKNMFFMFFICKLMFLTSMAAVSSYF